MSKDIISLTNHFKIVCQDIEVHSQFLIAHIMSKIIFYKLFTTCLAQNAPEIKNAQNLSKFGTSNISSMVIFILMSKIIFMKYLSPVIPKLVPKLKMVRIY